MLDIVFQTAPEQIDNTSILLMCFAGNITIFAFGYPYIFRAINNLSIISSVLCNRVKNNRFIKFYSCFLLIMFTFNTISLLVPLATISYILSIIFLVAHICYVMGLYYFIENRLITPFNAIINKNIHEANSTLKNLNEFENDIILLFDIIYYSEKNSFKEAELQNYFIWLVDATILKFKNYDFKKNDNIISITPEDNENLFSVLLKIQRLNQWAVNEKKLNILSYINKFFYWILWYGISPFQYLVDNKFPLSQSIQKIEKSNNYNQQNAIKYIQFSILEYIKQSILYRINNRFVSTDEMNFFVQLLYYCLTSKPEIIPTEKYEPCFSIISKMIDNNYPVTFCQDMIKIIDNYFWGKNTINKIYGFHVNVMSYLIFSNKYQILKFYSAYTKFPTNSIFADSQIPNNINDIISIFIGNDSVFRTIQTFPVNVFSFNYKFYILFLLINYCKILYDSDLNQVKKSSGDNFNYNWINDQIKLHSEFSLDFSTGHFDTLTSYLYIENYQESFECFTLEKNLRYLFNVTDDNLNFISKMLDDVIIKIKKARNILLQENISNIVKKEFSIQLQNELNAKNIYELFNNHVSIIKDNIKNLKFSCRDASNLISENIIIYHKIYDKEKFLLYEHYKILAEYTFDSIDNFYCNLLNLLITYCKKVTDIIQFPDQLNNYEILSTTSSKNSFLEFGFSEENLKCKVTLIKGKLKENSSDSEIKSIIIHGQEVKISKNNWNFRLLNGNNITYLLMLLIDSSKLDISIEDGKPIQFRDIQNGDIEILNNTKVIVKVPKNKELGYYIIKKK